MLKNSFQFSFVNFSFFMYERIYNFILLYRYRFIVIIIYFTSISFIRSFSDAVSFPPQAMVPATIKIIPKNIAYFLYSKSTQQYIISCQDHYKHHNNRDRLLHQLPPGYPEIFRNDCKTDMCR